MNDTLELIRTMASVVSATAIVVGVCQFRLAKKQFELQHGVWKTQHERARREKAVEIIRTFTQSITFNWSSTHKLVERMATSQLKALNEGQPFAIPESEMHEVQAALPGESFKTEDHVIKLTGEQAYKLRFQALEVLNSAEMVFQAWDRDVADPKIIEDEMLFLYEPDAPQPTTCMQRFREILQGERYFPALYKFIKHLQAKKAPNIAPPERLTHNLLPSNMKLSDVTNNAINPR